MNNTTPQTHERPRGIVANFSAFQPPMLQNMKYDLGLYMDISHLTSLQAYYRNHARRDPSLDEIYLFDKIIAQREYQSYPIMKLFTDSPIVAQTYADLIQKYNAVNTVKKAPTANSLINVAAKYFKKCGKKSSVSDRTLLEVGRSAELELMLKHGIPALSLYNAALGHATPTAAIQPGHLIVILSKGSGMTDQEFRDTLKEMLREQNSAGIITGNLTSQKGVLRLLCQYRIGAFIDISALPGDRPVELTALCDTASDFALVIIAQENVNTLLRNTNTYGITASVIGSLCSDKCITIRNHMGVAVSYPLSLINSLMTPEHGLQVFPDNAHNFVADARAYACRTIAKNSDSVLSAHSSPATFFNALYTTLCSVSDCVAAGASYKDVCLSFDIHQPITSSCNDIAVACLLGAYRAQIEFYLPDVQSRFTISDNAPAFTSYATAWLDLPHPHQYSVSDHDASSLYLLKPSIEQNGLVNFEQLRKMWNYVTELVKTGDILYAAAVSPSGVGATISALTQNTSCLVKSDKCTDELLSSAAPGGILAITRVRLNGIFLGNLNLLGQ